MTNSAAAAPWGAPAVAGRRNVARMMDRLHPALADWFTRTLGRPTDAQLQTVPHILAGRHVLLSSPTGSGKTLAGFLGVLDDLMRHSDAGTLGDGIQVLYLSPLRALTYDMGKNLAEPLADTGYADAIAVGTRTGDTSTAERAKQRRKPPQILMTTPESLAVLLPQKAWRPALQRVRFVIVDELHALAPNKRGSHLMLSLERLSRLVALADGGRDPVRIGLSATVAPMEEVGRFLVGRGRHCELVQAKIARRQFVEVMTPLRRDPYPPAGWTGARVIRDIARVIGDSNSAIIFCNTRSGAENISYRLKAELPGLADRIGTHHGSLDRDLRQEVEDKLKRGELKAVVCSTSLELGVDIGGIDVVVLVSTPKGINRTLQRIGRSGHSIHQTSHGILVATNINDLVECLVCARMTRRAELDEVRPLRHAADILAQHLVGMAIEGGYDRGLAFATVTRAEPYHDLNREEFDRVVDYLKGGGRSLERQYTGTFGKITEGEDGAWAAAHKRVERDYLVNVGTIHSEGMVAVLSGRRRLGEVEERFLKNLRVGDLFVLAGRTLRLVESGVGEIKVREEPGRLPTVPSWNANKMPLASGLARQVAALRTELARRMDEGADDEALADWLVESWHASLSNAAAVVRHFRNQRLISEVPVEHGVLIERFEPSADDPALRDHVHVFVHSLIGRSANDALSRIISWRLKETVGGNTMVTIDDYGFMLTLRRFQSLDLDGWRDLFRPDHAGRDLERALHESELVKWQFRGVAQTGLMVPRQLPGRERRLKQVRWSSEILFQVLSRHEPDHPMLQQAYREAMHMFLDTGRAVEFLRQAGQRRWRLVDVPCVSPFAFGIYVSRIQEGMMMEDPAEAIERLYREFQASTGCSADTPPAPVEAPGVEGG